MKENKGGFLNRIDVDLLVLSMKGATIMKSIQEENIEYLYNRGIVNDPLDKAQKA